MNEDSIIQYISTTFADVGVIAASGDWFLFYEPHGLPSDHRFPFATLVTSDNYDRASHLSRPSVFRLNLGVSRDTYRELFGPQPRASTSGGVVDTGHDFTVLDRILPHPIYAPQSWICVLNPSDDTFHTLRPLLTEAHDLAVKRFAKLANRRD